MAPRKGTKKPAVRAAAGPSPPPAPRRAGLRNVPRVQYNVEATFREQERLGREANEAAAALRAAGRARGRTASRTGGRVTKAFSVSKKKVAGKKAPKATAKKGKSAGKAKAKGKVTRTTGKRRAIAEDEAEVIAGPAVAEEEQEEEKGKATTAIIPEPATSKSARTPSPSAQTPADIMRNSSLNTLYESKARNLASEGRPVIPGAFYDHRVRTSADSMRPSIASAAPASSGARTPAGSVRPSIPSAQPASSEPRTPAGSARPSIPSAQPSSGPRSSSRRSSKRSSSSIPLTQHPKSGAMVPVPGPYREDVSEFLGLSPGSRADILDSSVLIVGSDGVAKEDGEGDRDEEFFGV